MRSLQPLDAETGAHPGSPVTTGTGTTGNGPEPTGQESGDTGWEITLTPGGPAPLRMAPSAPPGAPGAALLLRVAAFGESDLRSAEFLWCEDGQWSRCRLEQPPPHTAPPGPATTVLLAVSPLDGPPSGLTAREIDIISLVALGLSNREISSRLGTSIRTVTTQVERLLRKLGQDSRAGLSALAVDRDLIRLPLPGGVEQRSGIRVLDIERHTTAAAGAGTAIAVRPRPRTPGRTPGGGARRATVRIGTIAVSGPFAADGRETAQGAALAVRDINTLREGTGSRAIDHVVVEIDPLDDSSVRDGLAALVEADVDAITSSYASALSPEVFDFAAEYGRVFLHTNTWTRSVDAVRDDPRRYGHIFQTCPSETAYQSALLAFLRTHSGTHPAAPGRPPRLAVVELDGYGCAVTDDTFAARVAEIGWTVASTHRVGLTVDRVDELIQGVLGDRPDIVVVSHLSVDTAAALQNAITRHSPHQLTYHIYTPSVPGFARRIEHGGGQVIWSTVTGRPDDPLGRRFSAAYADAFGTPPGRSQASAAHDQIRMLYTAFSLTGSFRPAAVGGCLRDSAHRGVNGTYLFAEPGQSVRGYPYDTGDRSLSQPTLTYRLSGAGQEILTVA